MPLFGIPDSGLFRADSLSWVMAGLILLIIANVSAFSIRHLAGDSRRKSHQILILLLGACVLSMAFADHLLVLLAGWTAGNMLLVRLMIHKAHWAAARNSGLLALKTFLFGIVLLGSGFWLLAHSAGTASISEIIQMQSTPGSLAKAGLILIALAAMSQSAAWPLHRWLVSSLNSPTTVSALMHAGLVNAGGFLLVRLAPLYARETDLLHGLFVVGLITAVVGTFWKLLQTDIKRMLACSTMGQMGFMLMQCGMGLFAPAVSHLCWHGLFKAYLFLSTGSAVQDKPSNAPMKEITLASGAIAGLAGLLSALTFAWTTQTPLSFADTRCAMILLAFMAGTQLALGVLGQGPALVRLAGSLLAGAGAGALYGLSIRLIEAGLSSLHAIPPRPMDATYWAGLAVIIAVWLAMILKLPARLESLASWKGLYMAALNASQPAPKTVTATRTSYQS
jgi:NAD(P)H-quinone oxidoreductase subunit 5